MKYLKLIIGFIIIIGLFISVFLTIAIQDGYDVAFKIFGGTFLIVALIVIGVKLIVGFFVDKN